MDDLEMIGFHVAGRRTGKTTQMLEWMCDAPEGEQRVMVCATHALARVVYEQARRSGLNLEAWQFVGVSGVDALRGRTGVVLGIDNAETVLQRMFKVAKVGRVSATGTLVGEGVA